MLSGKYTEESRLTNMQMMHIYLSGKYAEESEQTCLLPFQR